MCRQSQLRGAAIIAFGLGLLTGCCMESGFWCVTIGVGAVIFGFLQLCRK